MRLAFILFIVIAFSLIASAHGLLYFSWLRFFDIQNHRYQMILKVGLGLLSASFIISLLLAHRFENLFTKAFYQISSVWLGLFLYLLIAALLGWILFLIVKIMAVEINMKLAMGVLTGLAIFYSCYGIWNASNPALRKIDVSMTNLPESWCGRTAVQISDLHLGMINGAGFLNRIVDKIIDVKPDIIFITGDLFDGMGDDLESLVKPLARLKPPSGIFYINGNHETYLGVEKANAALDGIGIRVLIDEVVELDGMQILGVDFPKSFEKKDINAVLKKLDSSKPNIVLYHTPQQLDSFRKAGVNLQLAGHTHRGQLWPFNYISNAVYGGFDYGFYQDGNYTLYTSCGTGTWGPPMRTWSRSEIVVIKFK